jgi:hypothetical protein
MFANEIKKGGLFLIASAALGPFGRATLCMRESLEQQWTTLIKREGIKALCVAAAASPVPVCVVCMPAAALLDTCFWLPSAACCWLLAAGCWLLVAGCWLLAASWVGCCRLLFAGCWLLAAAAICLLLAAGCWLLAAGCIPLVMLLLLLLSMLLFWSWLLLLLLSVVVEPRSLLCGGSPYSPSGNCCCTFPNVEPQSTLFDCG